MISFKQFLFWEARRNPEENPKISSMSILEQYKDDPDVYISYRSIEKIGINPQSKYNTPNGIYTYPLKEIFPSIQKKGLRKGVPYAGNQPYIYVIKLKPEYKNSFIEDLYQYDSKNYDDDLKKLKSYFVDKTKEYDVQGFMNVVHEGNETAYSRNPSGSMWNITRLLSGENPNKWNHILRVVLGYCGMADKSGMALIHEAEPLQAVFLDIKSFKVLHRLYNKTSDVNTHLFKAVKSGDTKKVELLLNQGADPNTKNEYGSAPLHEASWDGYKEIVELLLKYGADPNAKNEYGVYSPLHVASSKGYKETVELLLNYGADPNAKNEYGSAPLLGASSNGHKEIVEVLLNQGADPNVKNNDGNTPLHIASVKRHKEIIEVLLNHGADPNVKNNDGNTPLHIASRNGNKEIVELLKQYGAKE